MVKLDLKPSLSISLRRMRTQAEWNVETHISRARGPTSASTRSFISAAALLVNVIARIEPGWASRWETSQAIRRVSTRVLPEPGAGDDEQRRALVDDRGALRLVEPGEEVVGGRPCADARPGCCVGRRPRVWPMIGRVSLISRPPYGPPPPARPSVPRSA